ncbi:acyl-CoA dehydrogenase family protein [Saccharopolyspora taberi]|uniref:Acyl-CoA dehydrogenase C-terminal domain-containing protein n=1 Tax=Saccharopolyspora taberi TaxID=60895 RepID=A0ABN3VHW9_9PSEU
MTNHDAVRFRGQLDQITGKLAEALPHGDLSAFYRTFRETDLPLLPVTFRDDPRTLFRLVFETLQRLGALSPATALAVENHFYVSSAIATFPAGDDVLLEQRRHAVLDKLGARRALVANTNSKIQGNKLGQIGTVARRKADRFVVTGRASYTSLATEGDVLVFLTRIEDEGHAIFVIDPMQGNPAVEIGPYLFPSAMQDSDTRQITFHDLELTEDDLLLSPANPQAGLLIEHEMAWHQLLIPALYLGAAAGALEAVRTFLRGTTGRDGKPLAELDGMVVDVGRLALDHRSACFTVLQAGETLATVRRLPDDEEALRRAANDARAAKYVGTRCAEEIVTAARRIVGARSYAGGHVLERLSQEVAFGPLGPEVSAAIERRYGEAALGDESFTHRSW